VQDVDATVTTSIEIRNSKPNNFFMLIGFRGLECF